MSLVLNMLVQGMIEDLICAKLLNYKNKVKKKW